jgi:type I restriction enzyme S subunit
MKKNNSGNLEEPDLMDNEELPEGWQESPLLELCELIRGVSYTKGEESHTSGKGFVPLLRANNIDRELKFDDIYYVPERYVKPKQFLQQGDALFAMSSGSKSVVGKAATVKQPFDGTFGAFCGVLRPSNQVNWKFFGYFFQTKYYRDRISEASAGVNINNLKREYFEAINFPLPSLAEQQRIVARVEALLMHVNAAHDRLSRVPLIMKRFRQAVLAAACCGRLTEDLYDMHYPIFSQNDQFKANNKHPSLDNKDNLESSEYYELPSQWSWIEFSQLLKKSPQNGLYKKFILNPKGVRLLDIKGLYRGIYANFEGSRKISLSSEEINIYSLNNDDLLINRVSKKPEGVGKAVLVKDIDEPSVFESNMIRVNLNFNRVISPYILYYLQSEFARDKILKSAKMTNQASINQQDIKNIPVPLPPLAEQHEIVRRVGSLFDCADAFDQEVAAASRRCDRLTQAVLGKAFRGELVTPGMVEGSI